MRNPLVRKPVGTSSNLSPIAMFVNDLMNARTSFHKLHLKVTGAGSYAAHLALNDLYDALPDHADAIAENYQGATQQLLELPDSAPVKLNTVGDAIAYISQLYSTATSVQSECGHSEIINLIDEVKSDLNKASYKLKFLS